MKDLSISKNIQTHFSQTNTLTQFFDKVRLMLILKKLWALWAKAKTVGCKRAANGLMG